MLPLVIAGLLNVAGSSNVTGSSNAAAPVQHLRIAATPSAKSVKAGERLTLYVDVIPDPGIHVYAPGAKDYLPIALTLDAAPGVTAGKPGYPKPEALFFEPLNEFIPVYQKPFRIVEEVTVGKSARPGPLTIRATVRYQACDDRVCFVPATVPVTWTVDVK